MQITVNGKTIDIDDSKKLTIHVPGTKWTVEYFGHQVNTMDVVLTGSSAATTQQRRDRVADEAVGVAAARTCSNSGEID